MDDFRLFLLSPLGIVLTGFGLLFHGIFSFWLFNVIGFIPFCAWVLGVYFLVCLGYDRAVTFRRKKSHEQEQTEPSYLFGVGR